MERRALVLDANILIRAVLGQRVRRIIEAHADNISFFIPETAYAEVEEHLARLVAKHGGDPAKALSFLRSIAALGTLAGLDLYGDFETEARKRLGHAIRRTGQFSQRPLRSPVRSGLRIRTSSVVASRPGRPSTSTGSWCNCARGPFGFTGPFGARRELTGVVDLADTERRRRRVNRVRRFAAPSRLRPRRI